MLDHIEPQRTQSTLIYETSAFGEWAEIPLRVLCAPWFSLMV